MDQWRILAIGQSGLWLVMSWCMYIHMHAADLTGVWLVLYSLTALADFSHTLSQNAQQSCCYHQKCRPGDDASSAGSAALQCTATAPTTHNIPDHTANQQLAPSTGCHSSCSLIITTLADGIPGVGHVGVGALSLVVTCDGVAGVAGAGGEAGQGRVSMQRRCVKPLMARVAQP